MRDFFAIPANRISDPALEFQSSVILFVCDNVPWLVQCLQNSCGPQSRRLFPTGLGECSLPLSFQGDGGVLRRARPPAFGFERVKLCETGIPRSVAYQSPLAPL